MGQVEFSLPGGRDDSMWVNEKGAKNQKIAEHLERAQASGKEHRRRRDVGYAKQGVIQRRRVLGAIEEMRKE